MSGLGQWKSVERTKLCAGVKPRPLSASPTERRLLSESLIMPQRSGGVLCCSVAKVMITCRMPRGISCPLVAGWPRYHCSEGVPE